MCLAIENSSSGENGDRMKKIFFQEFTDIILCFSPLDLSQQLRAARLSLPRELTPIQCLIISPSIPAARQRRAKETFLFVFFYFECDINDHSNDITISPSVISFNFIITHLDRRGWQQHTHMRVGRLWNH